MNSRRDIEENPDRHSDERDIDVRDRPRNKVKGEQVKKPDYSNSSKSRKPEQGKTRKPGSIFCVCSIQTYENGMLLCKTCDRFSHAECYRTDDLAKEHICGGCAVKTGVNCSNPEIQNSYLCRIKLKKRKQSSFLI